jgi:succinoglycan biosynthesis transport protein ExoP
MPRDSNNPEADWLRPPGEQAGLRFYVEVLRERIRIIGAVVLVTLIGAGAYLITAEKVYEANADLLITPAPADDPVLGSLGLPRASSDPTRDVETAAVLATSIEVANRAKDELGTDDSARALIGDVTAEPLASSNLVSITASASTPAEAAELANAFASGMVEDRTEALHVQIDEIVPQLEDRLDAAGTDPTAAADLQAEIAQLEVLRAGSDPTVRVETEAVPPTSAASPRPILTIAGALLAGLVLGMVGAFAAQTLDPRLRREQQLRSRYQLPILARVPRDPGSRNRPLGPSAISPPTKEAYRTLRANISAARRKPGESHSVLVTGSAPAEGKTSTALNLAASLALAGDRVILIEADLRRPAIAKTLGLSVERGVVGTLLEDVSLDDALVSTTPFGPNLQLLLADYAGGWMSELFSLHAAQRLLDDAAARADYVIVDSPPLTAVVDTLPLARSVDDVLVVARLGVTRLDKLQELAELLSGNDIIPVGFALVGTPRPENDYYYNPGAPDYPGATEEPREVPVTFVPETAQPTPERLPAREARRTR